MANFLHCFKLSSLDANPGNFQVRETVVVLTGKVFEMLKIFANNDSESFGYSARICESYSETRL